MLILIIIYERDVFRLIPCRSQTDMELAQHLLSPMSHRRGDDDNDQYDPEQQESRRRVTRILNFGTKNSNVNNSKPLALVTASSSSVATKTKFKIPTKPDRVMAAPGTFLECGKFKAITFFFLFDNISRFVYG